MAGITYLIDFENVGNKWADKLEEACAGDMAVLFYSGNSPKAMLDQFEMMDRKGVRISFRKCETGPNGLDFQLASEMGFMVGRETKDRFVILSDDRGYDTLAGYWSRSGVQVSRIGTGLQLEGMSSADAKASVTAWLEGPMAGMGLTDSGRGHVMGCAKACLEQYMDPDDRMARCKSDTTRIKGKGFLDKVMEGLGPALEGLFASDAARADEGGPVKISKGEDEA